MGSVKIKYYGNGKIYDNYEQIEKDNNIGKIFNQPNNKAAFDEKLKELELIDGKHIIEINMFGEILNVITE